MIKAISKEISKPKSSKIAVAGIQPSGKLHIGNYLGSIKNILALQAQPDVECVVFAADLHSLTSFLGSQPPKASSESVIDNSVSLYALYLACGIDPTKSTVFIQSHVPLHLELYWILSCLTPPHKLNVMTQYKTKKAIASLGLYGYPALMAADILLYGSDLVPVGEDQTQHLEIVTFLAQRLNSIAGKAIVNSPKPYVSQTPKVYALHDFPRKMSKTDMEDKDRINILDSLDLVSKKIMNAKTDMNFDFTQDSSRAQLNNLVSIYAQFADCSREEIYSRFEGKNLLQFKKELAEVVVVRLSKIQKEYYYLIENKEELYRLMEEGKMKALHRGYPILRQIKQAINIAYE